MSSKQKDELSRLLEDKSVKKLLDAPALNKQESRKIKAARQYAARFVFEAMRYGYQNGFAAGLENDARLFGQVVSSPSGQEWIKRFINKDPNQSAFIQLLEPQNK